MKTNTAKVKKNYHIGIIVIIILLIIIPLFLFFTPKIKQNNTGGTASKSIPTITMQPTYIPTSLPSESIVSNAPQQRLLDKVNNRQELSESDITVKNKILSSLPTGETSGTIYQTQDVTVQYIQSFNLFQAEITTTNISSAKTAATNWFINQGMSRQGLCDLPLSFYLNFSVKNQLPDNGASFNPLPEGC